MRRGRRREPGPRRIERPSSRRARSHLAGAWRWQHSAGRPGRPVQAGLLPLAPGRRSFGIRPHSRRRTAARRHIPAAARGRLLRRGARPRGPPRSAAGGGDGREAGRAGPAPRLPAASGRPRRPRAHPGADAARARRRRRGRRRRGRLALRAVGARGRGRARRRLQLRQQRAHRALLPLVLRLQLQLRAHLRPARPPSPGHASRPVELSFCPRRACRGRHNGAN